MLVSSVGVDLAKPGQSITNAFSKHHPIRLGVLLESDLGPGTKADCHLRIVRARKAPRPCRKIGRNQGFRDLSGTRRDRTPLAPSPLLVPMHPKIMRDRARFHHLIMTGEYRPFLHDPHWPAFRSDGT
jgi:hypothetical protein